MRCAHKSELRQRSDRFSLQRRRFADVSGEATLVEISPRLDVSGTGGGNGGNRAASVGEEMLGGNGGGYDEYKEEEAEGADENDEGFRELRAPSLLPAADWSMSRKRQSPPFASG